MHLQQDLRHVRGIHQFSEHLQRATDFHALYQLREYGAVPALRFAGWSHDTGMLHLWQHDHLCDVSPTNGHIATQLPAFQRQPYVKSYILTTTLRQRLQPPARRGRPVLECYESSHGSSERLTRARAHASTTTGVSA